MKKVLFIGYGEPEPASRYRVYQFYSEIKKKYSSLLDVEYFRINPQYRTISLPPSQIDKIEIFFRKIYSLYKCLNYEIIFLQRNPVRYLSPYYELFLKNILRKKLIFDFDDALWCMYGSYDKGIEEIIKISDHIIVGNEYLYNFAIKYNNKVTILNTIIDTDKYKANEKIKKTTINICWMGTKPGIEYLLKFEDVFLSIKRNYKDKVNFYIICNSKPKFKKFDQFIYLKWSQKIEDKILNISDIGLMPLIDDEFTKGKCGFKLIQYGAYSIVSVTSPIGINTKIIKEGINGYFAKDAKEWISKINYLIDNKLALVKMKRNSRKIIDNQYSLKVKIKDFVKLLNSV